MAELLLAECTKVPWQHPWNGEDFDSCFRQLIIERTLPAAAVGISMVVLAVALLRYRLHHQNSPAVSQQSADYTDCGSLLDSIYRRRHTSYGATGAAPSVAGGIRRRSNWSTLNDNEEELDVCLSTYETHTSFSSNLTPESETPDLPQVSPPLSIRDMILVVLTTAQIVIAYALYKDSFQNTKISYEFGLWIWALVLCFYLFCRRSPRFPSPSPHLRLVYTVGMVIDVVKARSALLAYAHGTLAMLPIAEIMMAGFAIILFLASFTQQRRRHGLPSNAPAGASEKHPPAPELTASIAQLMFFSWMDPMIWLGYKRPLEPKDLYDLMPEDRSERVCARWRAACRQYASRHGRDARSLTHRLFWFFRYRLVVQCLWTLGHTLFIFASPYLLRHILSYMEDPTLYSREQAFWFVAGLLGAGALGTVCQSQALWIGRKIGLQIKAIIIGEVYAKSLRRIDAATGSTKECAVSSSNEGLDSVEDTEPSDSTNDEGSMTSMGKITNLMAVDAHKVSEVSAYLHTLYQLPAEIVITVLMLYQLLGIASMGGLATIIVLVPIQWKLVSIWSVYQSQLMKASDRRMSMMNEILQGVRIIKFFAWEPQFEQQVASVRGGELNVLRKRYLVFSYSILLFFMAPVFVTLTTFTVYTKVMGHQLTASVAFTALALFKTLRGPMDQLPDFFSYCLQARVSVVRVERFLAEEETPKYSLSKLSRQTHKAFISGTQDPTYADVAGATDIGFINATFSWKPKASNGPVSHSGTLTMQALVGTENEPLLSTSNASKSTTANDRHSATAETSRPESNVARDSGFELRNLTANFPVGKLSIIAGPTGSGKTSLLMALLGEMRLVSGQVMIPGAVFDAHSILDESSRDPFSVHESVAYVAQQAWLLNDTIRGNITFGLPYNEKRYNEVVRMCALSRDFEILDAGDMTEVGERGVALSGGQRQRICLARAVYSPARHVIMDDCLSAVDAHTAKHLYESCLMSPYMAERTRILVTHAVGLTIKSAEMVVVMQDGQIAAAGTWTEVLQSGTLSEETLREANDEQQDAALQAETAAKPAICKDKGIAGGPSDTTISSRFDGLSAASGERRQSKSQKGLSASSSNGDAQRGKLTTDEGWSRGHVQWHVYTEYLRASGGMLLWGTLIGLFLVGQGLLVAQDWWLREWAASYSRPAVNSNEAGKFSIMALARSTGTSIGPTGFVQRASPGGRVNLGYFIGVYIAIALASVLIILGRSLVQFWSSLRASKELHERLLHTILRAPVRFFDITPVGRLINRFSKDMETIDQSLSSSLAIFVTELTASLAILVVISVITPAFTLGAIIIAIIYWIIGILYLSASREIKRFESVTKSPIYTQFGETLSGVSTIRAYGQESRFKKVNYGKIDDNTRPFIYMWGANRWLSIRVDLAGAFVSFMAGLLALTATGRMDAGLAGMSLSYALNFTEHILWVVRFYSVNEMNLNSVERVVEYLEVAPEAAVTIEDHKPPPEWPSEGRVSVENLVLRYAENLPPVIRGISFEVRPREKVGIVGRTGAGKSTLTLALLRIMEASAGRIVIDGIDIAQIGVGDLRSRLTIIPQDPVLFTGTIRTNLDPFSQHSDDELWLALRRAHLLGDGADNAAGSSASTISDMGDGAIGEDNSRQSSKVVGLSRTITGLEMAVMENGSNFSQGQRQLIALARALVKRTQVILLDEATASVDAATDSKIQRTIRTEFSDATLLCIAHRLRTIVDYDRVLVLDQGEIVEYDTPFQLLNKADGLFRHMCVKSGEYDYLFSAAERKHHGTAFSSQAN
ncbi:Transporter of the ATP-binding cassette (ABC) [Coemansia brasiliensis]|uniref:Transporter of the ATP-binding cassette (ABC) n=1 Tax=Coemansia brasiliensis TaxID=2650707 RepID=A0A9W8IBU4_9FUNG|nr:Transporter of the ATP-binding cassette (ABC) [Coemansia brasiliensis]